VYLNDPARGRRAVDAAEFDQAFTGVVLTFEPGPEFTRGGHPPSVMRSLRQYLDVQNATPRDSGSVTDMLQSLLNKEMTAVLTRDEAGGIDGVKKQVLQKIDQDIQQNSDRENKK